MTLHCVICGRFLRTPAAMLPAVETGPMPHPAGPVGPTCARNQGLVAPSLFTRKVTRRTARVLVTSQLELIGA